MYGVIKDTICIEELHYGDYKVVETYRFKGWLSGLREGVKPFFIRGGPDGRFERITLERQAMDKWQREYDGWRNSRLKDPKRFGDLECPIRPQPVAGEEPDAVLPPLQPLIGGLRGGAVSGDDSDVGPVGPHKPRPTIIEDVTLRGTDRVDVHRIVHATESEMEVEVEVISPQSKHAFTDEDRDADEEEPEPRAGPSKPLKRGRGRPRKDGTGPFRPASPTNKELVRDAFTLGQVPTPQVVDLVPIVDKPEARRAKGRLPERLDTSILPSGRALEEEEITNIMRWRAKALNDLDGCSNEEAAVLALDALDRVERARGISKNLKGDISHDLKVSAAIARHAILAICQRSSRFEAEVASQDMIDRLKAECLRLTQRTDQLKLELDKQSRSREFLLAKNRSREPSPMRLPESCPPRRGQKRDLRERRGGPSPEPLAGTSAEAEHDPLIPEIVMGSPVRGGEGPSDDRPLSPMTRYAADPQFMEVLNDIAKSLRD